MRVRVIDDGDIGWRVQVRQGFWPFWRTVFDRVLFGDKAVALMYALRRHAAMYRTLSASDVAHIKISVDRGL